MKFPPDTVYGIEFYEALIWLGGAFAGICVCFCFGWSLFYICWYQKHGYHSKAQKKKKKSTPDDYACLDEQKSEVVKKKPSQKSLSKTSAVVAGVPVTALVFSSSYSSEEKELDEVSIHSDDSDLVV